MNTDGLGLPYRAGVIEAIGALGNQNGNFIRVAVGRNVVCTIPEEREPPDHDPRKPSGGVSG